MVNSNNSSLHADITLNDNKLKEDNLSYLGENLIKDCSCETNIKIKLYLATSDMIRLYVSWNSRYIHFKLTYNLYRSLVLSILTYGCEAWTINVEMQKKMPSYKKKSHINLLGIKY